MGNLLSPLTYLSMHVQYVFFWKMYALLGNYC